MPHNAIHYSMLLVRPVSQRPTFACSTWAKANIKIGFEPLNRYLCRFILNSTDVLGMLEQITAENFTIVLDAFHMNLEEDNLVKAIILGGWH